MTQVFSPRPRSLLLSHRSKTFPPKVRSGEASEVVQPAAFLAIGRGFPKHGPCERYVLAALGNPSSFEDFYHESGLEVLVASYTRSQAF